MYLYSLTATFDSTMYACAGLFLAGYDLPLRSEHFVLPDPVLLLLPGPLRKALLLSSRQ